jgi:hypothetical protein
MRYQLSLPIEFDYARGGYYFTKPTTDLPLFQLSESDLRGAKSVWKPTKTLPLNSRSEPRSRNLSCSCGSEHTH